MHRRLKAFCAEVDKDLQEVMEQLVTHAVRGRLELLD